MTMRSEFRAAVARQRPRAGVLACGTVWALVSGCAFLERATFSAPLGAPVFSHSDRDAATLNYHGWSDDFGGTRPYGRLEFPHLGLTVRVANRRALAVAVGPWIGFPLPFLPWPPALIGWIWPDPATLDLELLFQPRGQAFTVLPMQAVLRIGDQEIRPAGYRVPCADAAAPMESGPEPVAVQQPTCIRLSFPTRGSPKRSYVLALHGVERADAAVNIPEIRLGPASAWGIARWP